MIYTSYSLFDALKAVIANLPVHASAIDIRMRPDEIPEMRVTEILYSEEDTPVVKDGKPAQRSRQFVIVPLEDDLDFWAEMEKLRISARARRVLAEIDIKFNLTKKEAA